MAWCIIIIYLCSAVGSQVALLSLAVPFNMSGGELRLRDVAPLHVISFTAGKPRFVLMPVAGFQERAHAHSLMRLRLRVSTMLPLLFKASHQAPRIQGWGNRLYLLMGGAEKSHHKGYGFGKGRELEPSLQTI